MDICPYLSVVLLKKELPNVIYIYGAILALETILCFAIWGSFAISVGDGVILAVMLTEKILEGNGEKIVQTQVKPYNVISENNAVNNVSSTEETTGDDMKDCGECKETEKGILKTKIISTNQRETQASKKRGKFLSALGVGLNAGMGGSARDSIAISQAQDIRNMRDANFETVVTFLVIYQDNTRETVETIMGDERYNTLVMYVE